MNMFCDNKATIDISHNLVQYDRTKNIEVDRNFTKQNLEDKVTWLPYIQSKDQLANILTKDVSTKSFYNSLTKLGTCNIYTST